MMDPIQVAACAEELQKLAQGLDPELLTALLGAGVGGYAGYEATHDPRNKVRNAVLAALAGGGLGYGLGHAMSPSLEEQIKGTGQKIKDIRGGVSAVRERAGRLGELEESTFGGGSPVRLRAPTPPSPTSVLERMGVPAVGAENVAAPGMYGR